MPETSNGVPYQVASDPPDGATLGYGIASWLEAAFTGGQTGQVLEQLTSADNKLAWKWPHARVAAPTPTGAKGDLWVPSSGTNDGVLHWHDGSGWVAAQPAIDTTQWARGRIVTVVKSDAQSIGSVNTWTDLTSLSITQTLSPTRYYEVTVGVYVTWQRNDSAPTARAAGLGRVLYGASTEVCRFLAYEADEIGTGEARQMLGTATSPPFWGTGTSATIKAQVMRTSQALMSAGGAVGSGTVLAWLALKDVGPVSS